MSELDAARKQVRIWSHAAGLGVSVDAPLDLAAGALLVALGLPAAAVAWAGAGRLSAVWVMSVALLVNGGAVAAVAAFGPEVRCVEGWPPAAAGWCVAWALTVARVRRGRSSRVLLRRHLPPRGVFADGVPCSGGGRSGGRITTTTGRPLVPGNSATLMVSLHRRGRLTSLKRLAKPVSRG